MMGGLWAAVFNVDSLKNEETLFRSRSDVSAKYHRIEHIEYSRPDRLKQCNRIAANGKPF
jgi:hypothetical protein